MAVVLSRSDNKSIASAVTVGKHLKVKGFWAKWKLRYKSACDRKAVEVDERKQLNSRGGLMQLYTRC